MVPNQRRIFPAHRGRERPSLNAQRTRQMNSANGIPLHRQFQAGGGLFPNLEDVSPIFRAQGLLPAIALERLSRNAGTLGPDAVDVLEPPRASVIQTMSGSASASSSKCCMLRSVCSISLCPYRGSSSEVERGLGLCAELVPTVARWIVPPLATSPDPLASDRGQTHLQPARQRQHPPKTAASRPLLKERPAPAI